MDRSNMQNTNKGILKNVSAVYPCNVSQRVPKASSSKKDTKKECKNNPRNSGCLKQDFRCSQISEIL